MKLRPVIVLILFLFAPATWGAPAKPRPSAGIGLVVIRPIAPGRSADIAAVTLYRDPGVSRIGALATKSLPGLAPAVTGEEGEVVLAVLAKKGEWLKVAYDEAGHEGWLSQARPWRYLSWESCLRGRRARLLPGLQREYYLLKSEPFLSSREAATLTRDTPFRVVRLRDDWALVTSGPALSGWLRWRDGDGRFLIALDETVGSESR